MKLASEQTYTLARREDVEWLKNKYGGHLLDLSMALEAGKNVKVRVFVEMEQDE